MKFSQTEVTKFKAIFKEASNAADKAGKGAVPTPMRISGYGRTEVVNDGVCGFANLQFNGRGKFAGWLKQEGLARKGVYGGLHMPSYSIYSYNGQSYERKTAAMYAAETVFRNHGIKCYAESRLDQIYDK